MKRHVVLPHELHQLHIVGVLPPGLPVPHIVGGDADVADGGIKPDIEHLVLIPRAGDYCAPLEVPSDTAYLQPIAHPGVGHLRHAAGGVAN